MLQRQVKLFIALAIFAVLIVAPACKNDNYDDDIPYAYVDIYIYPNSSFYWRLNSPGGWEYIVSDPPSRGIIVYRASDIDFYALERTCAFDPIEPGARVYGEYFTFTVACPECGTEYTIPDGVPFNGPGKRLLRQYRTQYDGNLLRIFN